MCFCFIVIVGVYVVDVFSYRLVLSEKGIVEKSLFKKPTDIHWEDITKIVSSLDAGTIELSYKDKLLVLRGMKTKDALLAELQKWLGEIH